MSAAAAIAAQRVVLRRYRIRFDSKAFFKQRDRRNSSLLKIVINRSLKSTCMDTDQMRTLAVDLHRVASNGKPSTSKTGEREESGGGISEHFYREKLSQLKQQLVHLRSRQHPKYVAGLQRLQQQLQERLDYEDLVAKLDMERIERDYDSEKTAADRELEERKADLMESLYNELDEKRKQIEHEYQSMDLTGTSHNVYPANKKSLRRRPNEPAPLNEKRQRKASPQQIVFQLSDGDINDDLKMIGGGGGGSAKTPVCGGGGQSPARCASVGVPQMLVERHVICTGDLTATIDGSKLTLDGKCFLRAQAVFVETSDLGKLATTIQTIGNTEIYLKSIGENKRIVVTLSELQQGRAALKKRS